MPLPWHISERLPCARLCAVCSTVVSTANALRAVLVLIVAASLPSAAHMATAADLPDYEKDIRPIVDKYCYDCHGHGEAAGQVAFDTLKTASPHEGAK